MAVSLAPRGKRQRLTGIEALESNALIADAIQGESHLPAGLVMKNAAVSDFPALTDYVIPMHWPTFG
jgi:hypothetical protein